MNKNIASIILCSLLIVLVGCSSSVKSDPELEKKFFASVESAVKQAPKVDLTEIMNNEFYNIVRQNKNPLSLSFGQRVNLFLACAELLDKEADAWSIYNTYESEGKLPFKTNAPSQGSGGGFEPTEREAQAIGAINSINEFNRLLCLNGFPIYKDRIEKMVYDAIFNPERITFKERDKLIGWTEIFPEGDIYYEGLNVNREEEPCEGTSMGTNYWYGLIISTCSYDTELALDLCKYNNPEVDPKHGRTICPSIFYNAVITKYRRGIDDDSLILTGVRPNTPLLKAEEVEIKPTATYEERLNEYKESSQPNQQEQSIIEAKQKIIETKTYDFPEIKVNKMDIYYIFNYDPTLKKIFSPYNKIGLNVDGSEYVFLLNGGELTDIREESTSGSDFVLTTSVNEINELLQKGKDGDIVFIVKKVVTMGIPLKVKFQLMKNYVG